MSKIIHKMLLAGLSEMQLRPLALLLKPFERGQDYDITFYGNQEILIMGQ